MSIANAKKKLLQLVRERDKALEELLQITPLLRGSVSRVYTRCGKPNCWCAESAEGHAHTRITWSHEGMPITRKIPGDQIQRVTKLTESHRKFRSLRRALSDLDVEIRDLLRAYEAALDHRSRRSCNLLPHKPKNAAHPTRSRRKTVQSRKRAR